MCSSEQNFRGSCAATAKPHRGVCVGLSMTLTNFQDMTYWGGTTAADNFKCACGLTNSCADPSYGCNCDANDHVWREDSGFLTEKSDLPVLMLRFGDSGGSHERGYHTLGKFKCYGNA